MTLLSLQRQLLGCLLGLTVASGLGADAVNLEGLPASVLEDALAELPPDAASARDRGRLLDVLARDPHPDLRAAVAHALAEPAPWVDTELDLLSALAVDASPRVRDAAVASFPSLLERATPPRRLEAVATWATAEHEGQRLAAALGLGRSIPVPAAALVLEHLVADPSASVRRTALESVRSRYVDAPRVALDLAEPALADPNRPVRGLARRLYAAATVRLALG